MEEAAAEVDDPFSSITSPGTEEPDLPTTPDMNGVMENTFDDLPLLEPPETAAMAPAPQTAANAPAATTAAMAPALTTAAMAPAAPAPLVWLGAPVPMAPWMFVQQMPVAPMQVFFPEGGN